MKPKSLDRKRMNEMLAKMPVNRGIGMKVVRVWKDGVTMEVGVKEELKNLQGTLHGGITAMLVDTATGAALIGFLGGERRVTTVEFKMNYLRPVTEGVIRARTRFLKMGKTLVVMSCDVHDAHGHPVAAALVTYMML